MQDHSTRSYRAHTIYIGKDRLRLHYTALVANNNNNNNNLLITRIFTLYIQYTDVFVRDSIKENFTAVDILIIRNDFRVN